MPLHGHARPDPKPERQAKPDRRKARAAENHGSETFKIEVSRQPCILASVQHKCVGRMQSMHVVPQQTLRRRGLARLLWDPRNGVNGCERAHTRHDLGVEKIPRSLLPVAAFRFAIDNDLVDALERHWPRPELITDYDYARLEDELGAGTVERLLAPEVSLG